ncbi:MAG TPA: hypothetical protein VFK51_03175 [Burkholderiales bacterium]|nr:hypothetical protein [Burkholderiales bacterium]
MVARRGTCRLSRGQAMTEFVIGAALFLIPVFLLIPILGKFIDMKAATVQAARYTAWERTVWYGGDDSSVDWESNVRTTETIQQQMQDKFTDPVLWKDRVGNSMLQSWDGDISNGKSPGTANDLLGFAVDVLDAIGPFTLEMDGLYSGTATLSAVNVQGFGAPLGDTSNLQTFDNFGLTFTDKDVILANAWNANGPDMVKKQVQGLLPTSILDNVAVKALLDVMSVVAPELGTIEFGKIEPDIVPPDRLGGS